MSLKPTREELLQSEDVQRKIAERAYYKAEQGGFAAGREHDHWVEAEAETLEELMRENGQNGEQAPAKTTRKRATTARAVEPAAESGAQSKTAAPKASRTTAAKTKAAEAAAVPPAKPAAAKRTTKKATD